MEKEKKKQITTQHLVKHLRKLNEEYESKTSKVTRFDQEKQEERFKKYVGRDDVVYDFIDLEVYDDLVIWGGTIDDVFKFFYRVTPDKKTSSFEFKYLDDFDPLGYGEMEKDEHIERQMEIFNKVKDYYNDFANYWRENMGGL